MRNSELTVFVGELLGVPKVSLSGTLGRWHEQAVMGIMNALREQGTPSMVLDMAGLDSSDAESTATMLNVFRSVGPGTCVHVVASEPFCNLLKRANIGPGVKVYCSIDEISKSITPENEYLTSRYIAPGSEDTEMPLAA
ncbi:MAG: hypothetical protein NT018_14440 [Armatimonadetes bacterium]|nr:hypothetical protein [Armatimonadota bacterium]